jgi:soluble lytic murein transglycosylase-like protein
MLEDMVKDMTKGYVLVEYKWVLLAKSAALCLIVIPFLMLSGGEATSPAKQVNDALSLSVGAPTVDAGKSFKPLILRWMRDKSEMPEQILSAIYDAAAKNNNPDIIIAIGLVESRFNPVAKSKKGAMGLMGIMPNFWLEELIAQGLVKEKRDLYEIPSNVASGAYIFERYLSKTNNIEKALFEYVGGDPYYAGKVLQALGEIYLARSSGAERS